MKTQAFQNRVMTRGNESGLLFGKRPRFEFSFFGMVQKTKTATLDFSLGQLTSAMD